jgi:hypothetical protein
MKLITFCTCLFLHSSLFAAGASCVQVGELTKGGTYLKPEATRQMEFVFTNMGIKVGGRVSYSQTRIEEGTMFFISDDGRTQIKIGPLEVVNGSQVRKLLSSPTVMVNDNLWARAFVCKDIP